MVSVADRRDGTTIIRHRYKISGIVQGVGFRPFVYRLAHELALSGWTRNTPAGVDIEVQGAPEQLEAFDQRLTDEVPPLASISSLTCETIPLSEKSGFSIISPKVYNEFSPGNSGKGGSYAVRGAVEFPAFGLPWMLEGDYRSWSYPHNSSIAPGAFTVAGGDGNPCPHAGFPTALTPAAGDQGCVTVIGAYGQTAVPSFTAHTWRPGYHQVHIR